jgi:hypothetical protein
MPALRRPLDTRNRFLAVFGDQPVVCAVALDAGFTRAALRAAVSRGLLDRPRRGVIRVACPPDVASRPTFATFAEHLGALRAAVSSVGEGAMASHESAAALHGIATPSTRLPPVVQLVHPGASNFTSPGLLVRISPVPDRHRAVEAGIACTGVARTAVDLARRRRLPGALIALDSAARILVARDTGASATALREAVLEPEHRERARSELRDALDSCFGWAGTVGVRDALEFVDPASESPLESRSRGWFLQAGLPRLSIGRPIPCRGRTYWADFCSETHRVIGEADGWAKYGDTAEDMRAAMEHERARQRDLEADGWTLVRWASTDTRRAVVHRMATALHAA